MKTIGFPISHKENEKRRAIVPEDIKKLTYPQNVYIESGFGDVLSLTDEDYKDVDVMLLVERRHLIKI